jgi:hypothetical protein
MLFQVFEREFPKDSRHRVSDQRNRQEPRCHAWASDASLGASSRRRFCCYSRYQEGQGKSFFPVEQMLAFILFRRSTLKRMLVPRQ